MSMIAMAATAISLPYLNRYQVVCRADSCEITSSAIVLKARRVKSRLLWNAEALLRHRDLNKKAMYHSSNFKIAPLSSGKHWTSWYVINRSKVSFEQIGVVGKPVSFISMLERLKNHKSVDVVIDYPCSFDLVCQQTSSIEIKPLLKATARVRAILQVD